MLRYLVKETFKNVFLYAGIVLVAVMLVLGVSDENLAGTMNYDPLYLFEVSGAMGPVWLSIPILVTIPYACMHFEGGRGNFLSCSLIRTKRSTYLRNHMLAAYLSGFVTVLGGILLFFAVLRLRLWGKPIVFTELYNIFSFWDNMEKNGACVASLIVRCLSYCFYGGIWSLMSFVLSLSLRNKYVVVATPVIMELLMSYLFMLPLIREYTWFFDPGQLTLSGNVQEFWGGGIPFVVLYECAIIFLLAVAGNIILRRKYIYG